MHRRTHAGLIVAVGAALVSLATTASAGTSSLFFDDFERANQPLASGSWISGGGSSPRIDAGRACADVQAAGIFAGKVAGKHVRISYSFIAADTEGLEAYVVLTAGDRVYIVGCDGGGGACTPTIRSPLDGGGDDGGPQSRGSKMSLSANTTYRLSVELDDGLITLNISDASGNAVANLALSVTESFDTCGLVVGRTADGHLTCADDFRIEELGS